MVVVVRNEGPAEVPRPLARLEALREREGHGLGAHQPSLGLVLLRPANPPPRRPLSSAALQEDPGKRARIS